MQFPKLWTLTLLSSTVSSFLIYSQTSFQSTRDTPLSMTSSTNQQPVPGDSPAYYVGNPSNDILIIEALDLIPNPPVDHMSLRLTGNLKSDIGPEPRIKLTVSLNGMIGPSVESPLCLQQKLEITQNGTTTCPPKSGLVQMSYSVGIPYWVLEKGNYTVHAEMYATSGSRITGFEGTVFVNGEAGDGSGGWFKT